MSSISRVYPHLLLGCPSPSFYHTLSPSSFLLQYCVTNYRSLRQLRTRGWTAGSVFSRKRGYCTHMWGKGVRGGRVRAGLCGMQRPWRQQRVMRPTCQLARPSINSFTMTGVAQMGSLSRQMTGTHRPTPLPPPPLAAILRIKWWTQQQFLFRLLGLHPTISDWPCVRNLRCED